MTASLTHPRVLLMGMAMQALIPLYHRETTEQAPELVAYWARQYMEAALVALGDGNDLPLNPGDEMCLGRGRL